MTWYMVSFVPNVMELHLSLCVLMISPPKNEMLLCLASESNNIKLYSTPAKHCCEPNLNSQDTALNCSLRKLKTKKVQRYHAPSVSLTK